MCIVLLANSDLLSYWSERLCIGLVVVVVNHIILAIIVRHHQHRRRASIVGRGGLVVIAHFARNLYMMGSSPSRARHFVIT